MADRVNNMAYTSCSSAPRRPCGHPCRKGTNMIIARTLAVVASRCHARTGGQRKRSGRLFGYARVSVASDADTLSTPRRALSDCEQVFEDVGSGASWNRPGLNRLKAALQPGDCVKVAALDRLGRSLAEVLELLGWLRENQVEVIRLRESIDRDSATGRAMLHLAIVVTEMECRLARERMLVGLESFKATCGGWIFREGARGAAAGDPRGKRV